MQAKLVFFFRTTIFLVFVFVAFCLFCFVLFFCFLLLCLSNGNLGAAVSSSGRACGYLFHFWGLKETGHR